MDNIINEAYNFLVNRLKIQKESNFSGGENRAYSGATVELYTDVIVSLFKEKYPNLNITIKNSDDKIKIFGKNPDFFTEESVDRHIYINGKLVLIIECKTYLNKCYLQRACDDARLIKKGVNYPIQAWIISLENGISDMAYNFFMYQDDNININNCFFLSDGKRNSSKPIYKNYENRLNIIKIQNLIEAFDNFFKEYL